ncbi:tail fiber domain-containing protein [Shewanella sp.]|uniref:tail fiber domain-containing protein n=1 Tax=Shewanella sp. TaxID=50422 RepID=UPI002589ED25|nr:tail fiber domain-containing protein [Shewanella sp.]MCJ8305136.1 tail fiber domain-containing protein [Shewanella sp.]
MNKNMSISISTSTKKALRVLPLSLAISLAMTATAHADQVILDDLIVDGSACIGFDCVNGESFGFDTLRLKENNLRIKFQDTSSSSSFPSNDWQITVNDSSNGGANKFSIDDIDGARTPFTIEAGAPSHSLYVDDGGRLGLGTSTPVVDIHIKSGNTPTLRLEQDGTSGFTPQIWDVAGNEAGFFVRDATNGSTLPFRIIPGAPSNAITIAADGDVGIGTNAPTGRFEIKNNAGNKSLLTIANTGHIGIGNGEAEVVYGVTANIHVQGNDNEHSMVGIDTSDNTKSGSIAFTTAKQQKWLISSRNNFNYHLGSTEGRLGFFNNQSSELLTIHENGNLYIGDSPSNTNNNTNHAIETSTGAHLTTGGVWTNSSSRELKNTIVKISNKAALSALLDLNPVTYEYNSEPGETYAGFIAEDVPELVATNNKKGLSPMDIIAVLTKVVQTQNERLELLSGKLEMMNK